MRFAGIINQTCKRNFTTSQLHLCRALGNHGRENCRLRSDLQEIIGSYDFLPDGFSNYDDGNDHADDSQEKVESVSLTLQFFYIL